MRAKSQLSIEGELLEVAKVGVEHSGKKGEGRGGVNHGVHGQSVHRQVAARQVKHFQKPEKTEQI